MTYYVKATPAGSGRAEPEGGVVKGLATVFFVNDFEKMTAKWIGV